MDWMNLLEILIPLATGVLGWFFGRRKQNNDFLHDLQASINMLAAKNKELMDEIVQLRVQNATLQAEVKTLTTKLDNLKKSLNKQKQNENQ